MRSIYIALIFIGLLSLSYGAQMPYPERPEPEECDGDGKNVTGCAECIENMDPMTNDTTPFVCNEAQAGYFIEDPDSNITTACPAACGNCKSLTVCEGCRTNGFNQDCTNCISGFALNTGAEINTNLNGVCIPVAGPYSCNTGFFWNSLANPESKCVPTGTGSCLTGYSTTQDGKTTANITTDCNFCSVAQNLSLTTQTLNGNQEYYFITECLVPPTIYVRPPPQQCTADVNETESCQDCENGECVEAADGYFVIKAQRRLRYLSQEENVAGQVGVCMSQCETCEDEKTCKSCPTGSSLENNQCVCNIQEGYTPNIPMNASKIQGTQFNCVRYSKGFSCATGYKWSTPVAPVVSAVINQAECIGTNSSYSCYTDNRNLTKDQESLSLTSFWNQVPNPTRSCILATANSCAPDYSQPSNTTTSNYSTPLTENCNACLSGKKLVSQNGDENNQVCTSFSSVLSMTLILLGIVLALLF